MRQGAAARWCAALSGRSNGARSGQEMRFTVASAMGRRTGKPAAGPGSSPAWRVYSIPTQTSTPAVIAASARTAAPAHQIQTFPSFSVIVLIYLLLRSSVICLLWAIW